MRWPGMPRPGTGRAESRQSTMFSTTYRDFAAAPRQGTTCDEGPAEIQCCVLRRPKGSRCHPLLSSSCCRCFAEPRVPAGASPHHVNPRGSSIRFPPASTPRSVRRNAASWRRSISTGACCSSRAMMATCSPPTAGGVPACPRRPRVSRPGRAFPGCSRGSWPASWSASRAPTSCRTASTARACFASGFKSIVVIPLSVAQQIVGARELWCDAQRAGLASGDFQRLRLSASMFASVLARRHSDEALCRALGEVKRLSDQLRAENVYLRREVESTLGTSDRRPERRDSPRAGAGAPGRRDRCDGPPSGRDRLRQRGVRVTDP